MKRLKARATPTLASPLVPGRAIDERTAGENSATAGPGGDAQSEHLSLTPSSKTTADDSSRPPAASRKPKAPPKSSRGYFNARHDRRILLMALASGFPAVLVALILLWSEPQPA